MGDIKELWYELWSGTCGMPDQERSAAIHEDVMSAKFLGPNKANCPLSQH